MTFRIRNKILKRLQSLNSIIYMGAKKRFDKSKKGFIIVFMDGGLIMPIRERKCFLTLATRAERLGLVIANK